MKNILVPVDGSERAAAAVEEAIRQAKASVPLHVHLVNVQPPAFAEETMVGLQAETIDTYYYQQSEKALAGSEKLLRDADVPFTAHRAVGPVAETIATLARELECDAILMTPRGHGKIAEMLLGSVSTKLLHLAEVPVTFVKSKPKVDPGLMGLS